jgi:hypothetical protein
MENTFPDPIVGGTVMLFCDLIFPLHLRWASAQHVMGFSNLVSHLAEALRIDTPSRKAVLERREYLK